MRSDYGISLTDPSRLWRVGAFLAPLLQTFSVVRGRRFPLIVAVHAVLIIVSSYLALWLRFDGEVPLWLEALYVQALPLLLVTRGLVFVPFGLYGGLWRYTGTWDLSRIVLAVLASSVAVHALPYEEFIFHRFPRSFLIMDSVLLIVLLGGVRVLWRVVKSGSRSMRGRRVLVIGAGDAGEMIVREMRRGGGYRPLAFIDDDARKVGRTIHGVTVLGTRAELARVMNATAPEEVLIAMPAAQSAEVQAFVQLLEPYKLPITTLPGLRELVHGKVNVKQIRPLAIEDLLPRPQVALDGAAVRRLVRGKRVLVTGAGGSIGSELCRQIAALQPSSLILFERYENSLYTIANDLADRGVSAVIRPTIGDVTDARRVEAAFAEYRPELVFHAAAHKHVPLMEGNPCEAVKNNIGGTRIVAEASQRHGVERFVLISTDKAANPSSVMGATKRVAELIVQAMSGTSATRFVTVRFGNVLGSNGSVIPRMMEQIRAGGPVTVTHPEMRRFFMLIPEAVELVLQAAVVASTTETFVLDMGERVKVLDVARNLIRLSGFVPDEDIPITFIGLRPGEKLIEELAGHDETLEPAGVSKIFRVRSSTPPDFSDLTGRVDDLIRTASHGLPGETIVGLQVMVPTFSPFSALSAAGPGDLPLSSVPELQMVPGAGLSFSSLSSRYETPGA